jgi:putative transcriptional regulator
MWTATVRHRRTGKIPHMASYLPPPSAASFDDEHPAVDSAAPDFDLTGHFLIAMPSMNDAIFGGTVVYVCEHNSNGAFGVVINKPTEMSMEVLFDSIDLTLEIHSSSDQAGASMHLPSSLIGDQPVMFGGPVQVDRGFVLHSPGSRYSSTLEVSDRVAMTTSKDVLESVATGCGPNRWLISLGCAGWSAGQLEAEISRNGWLTVMADPNIIFDLPIDERFNAAIRLLGIDPAMLNGGYGRA